MKKFDSNYKLLEEMYEDGYFPDFLVAFSIMFWRVCS